MNKQFFPQVAERTIYVLLFAGQSFFTRNKALLPGIKWSKRKKDYTIENYLALIWGTKKFDKIAWWAMLCRTIFRTQIIKDINNFQTG